MRPLDGKLRPLGGKLRPLGGKLRPIGWEIASTGGKLLPNNPSRHAQRLRSLCEATWNFNRQMLRCMRDGHVLEKPLAPPYPKPPMFGHESSDMNLRLRTRSGGTKQDRERPGHYERAKPAHPKRIPSSNAHCGHPKSTDFVREFQLLSENLRPLSENVDPVRKLRFMSENLDSCPKT